MTTSGARLSTTTSPVATLTSPSSSMTSTVTLHAPPSFHVHARVQSSSSSPVWVPSELTTVKTQRTSPPSSSKLPEALINTSSPVDRPSSQVRFAVGRVPTKKGIDRKSFDAFPSVAPMADASVRTSTAVGWPMSAEATWKLNVRLVCP